MTVLMAKRESLRYHTQTSPTANFDDKFETLRPEENSDLKEAF